MTSPHSQALIRSATPSDYGAIAAIYNEAIAHGGITMDLVPYGEKDVSAMAQKMTPREALLVAVVEQVIGWGIVKRYSDRPGYQFCCETSIYLTFAKTNQGYGHQLQTVLMAQAQKHGYRHVVAKIVAKNKGSIRFHQQFGFEVVGTQTQIGYTHGTWHDVVIMQRILPS